jgi:hypothetical protein
MCCVFPVVAPPALLPSALSLNLLPPCPSGTGGSEGLAPLAHGQQVGEDKGHWYQQQSGARKGSPLRLGVFLYYSAQS